MKKNRQELKSFFFKSGNVKAKAFRTQVDFERVFGEQLNIKKGRPGFLAKMAKTEAVYRELKANNAKYLTPERIVASLSRNNLLGMLSNTGFSLEELAQLTNSSPEELLDPFRWSQPDFEVFNNSSGESYKFEFSYNASTVFTRIN